MPRHRDLQDSLATSTTTGVRALLSSTAATGLLTFSQGIPNLIDDRLI